MLLLLIANVIVLPVAISFFADELFEPTFLVFNIISDVFFLLDILFNFRTGAPRSLTHSLDSHIHTPHSLSHSRNLLNR